MKPEIKCLYDELVDPKTLKDHPKNRNQHGSDQIKRLSKLYQKIGVRHPIVVSKLSGCIVAGHGRKLSAIGLGMDKFPVVYQEFKDAAAEYAFMTSDNAISEWSELDLAGINFDIGDFGPDFDLDLLGMKNFTIDVSEKEPEKKEKSKKEITCPNCEVKFYG